MLIGFEATDGRGLPWRARFPRTLWCAAGGLAVTVVVAVWLGANGALDDYLFYFRTFAPDHALTGALPLPSSPTIEYVFAAALPVALGLVVGAFSASRLATGKEMRVADWAMASLAVLGILYYPKFLVRPDGHVYDAMLIAVPVLVYVVARGSSLPMMPWPPRRPVRLGDW